MFHPTKNLIPPRPPSSPEGGWRKRAQALHDDAELQSTFEHAAKDFHGTQHDALNAELRYKAESAEKGWSDVIYQATGYTCRTAPTSEPAGEALLLALTKYMQGYHSTLQQPMTEADVLSSYSLRVASDEINAALKWPTPDEIAVQRALASLQKSDMLLSAEALEPIQSSLAVLDELSSKPMAACSIAMHTQHHADTTAALREELKQGADYLTAMDKRIAVTSEQREEALAAGDYQRCLDCFQEEVAMGSDLVALNVQRAALFDDAEADAAAFATDVADLVSAASEMGSCFKHRTAALGTHLAEDLNALAKAVADAEEKEKAVTIDAASRFDSHKATIEAFNGQEALVWKDIVERMKLLEQIQKDRKEAVGKCMSDIEQASAERLRLLEVQRACRAHAGKLKGILNAAHKAVGVEAMFTQYVDTMAPILSDDVAEVHTAVHELKVAESTSILVRYDRFAHTAEECRQRVRNRLEGLERADRQRLLALETIKDSFDPNSTHYEDDAIRSELQKGALVDYLSNLDDLIKEARASVEGTMLYALQILEKEPADAKLLQGDVGLVQTGTLHRKLGSSPKRLPAATSGDVGRATVDVTRHPQLAAAVKQLALQDDQIKTAASYVSKEQDVVETRRAQLNSALRTLKDR